MRSFLTRTVLLGSFIMLLASWTTAQAKDLGPAPGPQDFEPTDFFVYSKSGDEMIDGDCTPTEGDPDPLNPKAVTCKFADFTIIRPKPLNDEDRLSLKVAEYAQRPSPSSAADLRVELAGLVEKLKRQLKQDEADHSLEVGATRVTLKGYRDMLAELEKDPSKVGKELREGLLEGVQMTDEQKKKFLNEPTLGPKTKEFRQQFVAALSAHDVVQFTNLIRSEQQRTCGSWLSTYSIEFKKLGKGRWLSNEGPQGACKIVRIYELDEVPSAPEFWTFTQKNITTGDISNPVCKMFANAEQQEPVEVFSWDKHEFELPCDFIEWGGTGH
jgi:hypothetical protein